MTTRPENVGPIGPVRRFKETCGNKGKASNYYYPKTSRAGADSTKPRELFSHIRTTTRAEQAPVKDSDSTFPATVFTRSSYAKEIDDMYHENVIEQKHLKSNADGSTFAAKVKAAELNALRTKDQRQAVSSHEPLSSSSSHMVFKPRQRQVRDRGSTTPTLPGLASVVTDANTHTNPNSSLPLPLPHPQRSSVSDHQQEPDSSTGQVGKTATSLNPAQGTSSLHPSVTVTQDLSDFTAHQPLSTEERWQQEVHRHQETKAVATGISRTSTSTSSPFSSIVHFPPLVTLRNQALVQSPPQLALSPTHNAKSNVNRQASSSFSNINVTQSIKMPRGDSKTGTPATRGGMSGQLSYRSSSGNNNQSDDVRNYIDSRANTSPSTPTPSSLQSRLASQHSRRAAMAGFASSNFQQSTGFNYPRQTEASDNPFQDQPHFASSNMTNPNVAYNSESSGMEQSYWPGDYHQNVPVGYFQQYPSQSPHYQPAPHDRHFDYLRYDRNAQGTSYPQQSPYAQQSAYRQSGHWQNTYPRDNEHMDDHFREQFNQLNYQFRDPQSHHDLSAAYQQSQQALREASHRAAVEMPSTAVTGTPSDDARVTALSMKANEYQMQSFYNADLKYQQDVLDMNFGPRQTFDLTKHTANSSNHPLRPNPYNTTNPLRDPAPYTGFSTSGTNKELMLRNLDRIFDTSKVLGDLSGATRTVLHDPLAHSHASSKISTSSTSSASTLKPMAPSFQLSGTHHQPATESNITQANEPVKSHGAISEVHEDEAVAAANHPAEPKAPVAVEQSSTDPSHQETEPKSESSEASSYKTAPQVSSSTEVSGQGAESSETVVEAANKSTHTERIIGTFLEGSSSYPRQPEQFFPKRNPIKYTLTGHPIPHGGFADFTTPYHVNYFTEPKNKKAKDYKPSNDKSQAAGNVMIRSILKASSDKSLERGTAWFRAANNDRRVRTVFQEFEARMNAHEQTTPRGLPKPIGHERGSFSASTQALSTTTTPPAKDLMKNPTADDGVDLVAGALANLKGYAEGTELGDYFTRWGRPAEWAIDRSAGGNKSFYGGGYETAPARAGRDPRFPKTRTGDGRETYVENPGRGRGRGRAM